MLETSPVFRLISYWKRLGIYRVFKTVYNGVSHDALPVIVRVVRALRGALTLPGSPLVTALSYPMICLPATAF